MGRRKKSELAINTKIEAIMNLLETCRDEGSLEVIASEILGYGIFDEDVDPDDGVEIIEECRSVLENITPPGEIDSLYKKLITHHD